MLHTEISTLALCLLAAFAATVFWPVTASAQPDVEISSRVDSDRVNPGDQLRYEIDVAVQGHFNIEMEQSPGLDDFAIRGRMSAPSYQVRGGDPERTLNLQFHLRAPHEPGTYTIDGPVFTIGNSEFSADDQTVEVTGDSRARRTPDDDTDRRGERAFLQVSLEPDRDPYVGEQLLIDYTLYVRHDERRLRPQRPDQPALDRFWVENLTPHLRRGRTREQRHGTHWYTIPIFTYAAFPNRPGPARIDAAEVPLHRTHAFGDDEPAEVVESDPVELEVQPLPDGAPEGFSSTNVGDFDFEVEAPTTEVEAGEQFRITARITGHGRVARLGQPLFDVPDEFHLLATDESHDAGIDRSTRRVGGERHIQYRLMALEEGRQTLPSLQFVYFDPDKQEYVTRRSDPVEFDVAPGDVPLLSEHVDEMLERTTPDTSRDPLDELHGLVEPDTFSRSSPGVLATLQWRLLIPLIGLVLLVFGPLLARPVLIRLSPRFRRRVLARRIDEVLDADDEPAARCLRALQIALTDGLELTVGALTAEDVRQALADADVSTELAADTETLVAELVERRYAPSADTDETTDLEKRTRTIARRLLDCAIDIGEASRHSASASIVFFAAGTALAAAFVVGASLPSADATPPDEGETPTAENGADWTEMADVWVKKARDNPGDPTLHYNAGTAAAHSGDLSTARYHLESAYAAAFDEPLVRHNLTAVTDAIAAESDHVVVFDEQRSLARGLHATGPSFVAAILWLALILAAVYRCTGRLSRRTAFACIATIVVCAAALFAAWAYIDYFPGDADLAVVADGEVPLYDGPSSHSDATIDTPLPGGAVVRTTYERDGWLEAELPGGETGWLRTDSVEPVVFPPDRHD